jgi:hypothetical protein
VALGHRASEGSDAQIRDPDNVRRVLQELEGCNLVVLSGNKARLLAEAIGAGGRQYIELPHVGNTGSQSELHGSSSSGFGLCPSRVPCAALGRRGRSGKTRASTAFERVDFFHIRENHWLVHSEDETRQEEEDFAVDTTGNGPTDKQREKRRGIAAESLVASMCVLGSDGELNVATSLVDDEGVDLVFYRSAGGPTLSVQVKAHFFDSPEKIERKGMNTVLSRGTFRARDDLYLLFLVVDQFEAQIQTAWLVPSVEFRKSKTGMNLRFQASPDRDSGSPWADFQVVPPGSKELAAGIMSALARLE